jgi:choline dehydrogenase-like flavoprotein
MTFLSANELDDGAVLEADVVVVGSGAAGLSLARKLGQQGEKVLLVEAGDLTLDGATQGLYRGEQLGVEYYDLSAFRLRYYGGTTNHWSGFCQRNDRIDYEGRLELDLPKWPVDDTELDPYITDAAKLLGLSGAPTDPEAALKTRNLSVQDLLDSRSSILRSKIFQFSFDRRLGPRFSDGLKQSKNIDVVLNLNARSIELSEDGGSVRHVSCATMSGKRVTIKGRFIALCCHAIENARLLLNSDSVHPEGVGNASGHVGRNFMEHPHLFSSLFFPTSAFPVIYDRKFLAARGQNLNLSMTDDTLRRERLLHYYCRFNPVFVDQDADDALSSLKGDPWRAGDMAFLQDVAEVVSGLGGIVQRAAMRRGFWNATAPVYRLEHRIEQSPNPNGCIVLSDKHDRLGDRIADLDWQFSDHDVDTFERGQRLIAKELAALGMGRVALEPIDRSRVEAEAKGHYHHIGLTRMSDDLASGVVDRHCKVHGVDNLYIGGSSIFPTAGYSGPTMMIMGFALRLADHLSERLNA